MNFSVCSTSVLPKQFDQYMQKSGLEVFSWKASER